ncbi:MAG: hypothetical protein FJY85_02310 [Deltaproteobacteria bacterium]|nr:hypothetical protein [Deltaproteobacteria bacterium]
MTKPGAKISASAIIEDIRAGMGDAQLMAKYRLLQRGLESLYRRLHQAGLLERPERRAPIAADRALVPIQPVSKDLVKSGRAGSSIKNDTASEWLESKSVVRVMESTTHLWLLAIGLFMVTGGFALYFSWPFLQALWREELELARTLGYTTELEHTQELWFKICKQGGPLTAIVGALVTVAGLLAWWLKGYRLEKILDERRERITPSSAGNRSG